MEGIDFLFIAIGLVCVIVSFFLSEKVSGGKGGSEKIAAEWRERVLADVKQSENLEEILKELQKGLSDGIKADSEEQLDTAKEELGRIMNEKMMAFGEYSDEVLEKIHQNHTEVVFLYDMLKQKESVLKDLAARIEGIRMQTQGLLSQVKAEGERLEQTLSGAEGRTTHSQAEIKRKPEAMTGNSRKNSSSDSRKNSSRKMARNSAGKRPLTAREEESDTVQQRGIFSHSSSNGRKEQILQMHQEGKSVLEISKLLGLGQGEVKLVIDLFQNTD